MSRRFDISDHALIRYLERVGGYDLEAVRDDLSERVHRATAGVSGMTAVYIDGARFVIRNGVVTTCTKRRRESARK